MFEREAACMRDSYNNAERERERESETGRAITTQGEREIERGLLLSFA